MLAIRSIFGNAFFMSEAESGILLAVCIVAAVCTLAVIALAIAVAVMFKRNKQTSERELADLTVDASGAKREFAAGEDFSCEGLLIVARYATEPKEETLSGYKVVTQEELSALEEKGKANDCYVVEPDFAQVGNATVTVKYMGKTADYTVSVSEPT